MRDDWRLCIALAGSEHAGALSGRLEATELSDEVRRELGDAIVVSHDGAEVFLYAGTHAALRAAERVVRDDLAEHGWDAQLIANRWHPDAEEWQPADAPAATTAAQKEAERARRMRAEDAESAGHGCEWEARALLPSRHAAHELSERLTREGVPHMRRWRYVLVGAADEDAAQAWATRLRQESPPGTEVRSEGTFAFVARTSPTPFRGVTTLGGGVL